MPRHAAGGKITSSHTTIIDTAEKVIAAAGKQEEVSKVSLGIMRYIGTGKRKITFTKIPAGFLVRVRGGTTIQEFYVHTSEPIKTREALFRAFWLR